MYAPLYMNGVGGSGWGYLGWTRSMLPQPTIMQLEVA